MILPVLASQRTSDFKRAFFESIPIWIRSTAFVLWFILVFDWTILRDVEAISC